jgi:DeoR/GlpR family transcriptional regulator of sugar metabolism
MSRYLRKDRILEYVDNKKVCSIDELLKTFKISVSTLHRDLNTLEREGSIDKSYGKVSVSEKKALYESRINRNIELKVKIAKRALKVIHNGDCIFLDNSTTSYYLARELCNSSIKDVLVVSNNGFISDLFLQNGNIDFIITGGILNKKLNCFIGPQAIRSIKDFNANIFFLSTSCISIKGEISDLFFPDVIDIKRRMYNNSKTSYILVDSTKFGKTSSGKSFSLKEVDHIITDSKISQEELKKFSDNGIDIIIS